MHRHSRGEKDAATRAKETRLENEFTAELYELIERKQLSPITVLSVGHTLSVHAAKQMGYTADQFCKVTRQVWPTIGTPEETKK
jgi:hypothetical protein